MLMFTYNGKVCEMNDVVWLLNKWFVNDPDSHKFSASYWTKNEWNAAAFSPSKQNFQLLKSFINSAESLILSQAKSPLASICLLCSKLRAAVGTTQLSSLIVWHTNLDSCCFYCNSCRFSHVKLQTE